MLKRPKKKDRTAIIIKGNSKYINSKKFKRLADDFYDELQEVIEELGYSVKFDDGKAYTSPPKADAWIGHSRGGDRLEDAPEGIIAVPIGVPVMEGSINNPDDITANVKKLEKLENLEPNDAHFILTDEMIGELSERLK